MQLGLPALAIVAPKNGGAVVAAADAVVADPIGPDLAFGWLTGS